MAGLGRDDDDDLEADNAEDWSVMNSRLDSFRGSTLAQQVSAERLARAGFYFTGHADRVRCFSCQKTVENWCGGDTPVERHKEVSPACKFLSCTHRTSFNSDPGATLTNGSPYNEEAEDMQFRLRTGEVVDESTYPMAPHMGSEDARLRTFGSWPSAAPVRPRELAQAGLYYLGESDRVQCFCCAGMLGGWEAGDTAWGEHSKHFRHCFFILGHDVGNVPSQGGVEQMEEEEEEEEDGESDGESGRRPGPRVPMGSFEERLNSFAGVQHPINPERLATAGFYCTGAPGDMVTCFCCGGRLKGWQPEEDPWELHAKEYPGCSFLLAEKGPEFVNSVQLQAPRRNHSASRHQNGFSNHGNDAQVLRSAMAQKAIEMGLDPSLVESTILENVQRTGSEYPDLEALLHDCFNQDPLEKLRKLQREKRCKVCLDRDICIVFIPCGHLATCAECSEALSKCPICCGTITQKIKTYIS